MKVPVVKIFKLTWNHLWTHKSQWMRVLFAPLILMIVGFILVAFASHAEWDTLRLTLHRAKNLIDEPWNIKNYLQKEDYRTLITFWAAYGVYFLGILQMMINTFRYAFLNEGGDRWWTLHFNKRLFKVALYVILYTSAGVSYFWLTTFIVSSVWSLKLFGLAIFLGVICPIALMYVWGRILLVDLSIAIDISRPLRNSWALTRGNAWRIMGLFITFFCIAALAEYVIAEAVWGIIYAGLYPINPHLIKEIPICMPHEFLDTLIYTAALGKGLSLVYQTLEEKKVAKPTKKGKK